MNPNDASLESADPGVFHFYQHAIEVLQSARVPFLLGGAYALSHYTGITRHTKDLDIFVARGHYQEALDAFKKDGYRAETFFAHWLGKVYHGDAFIDII